MITLCTLQGIRESQITQKVKDTECFMPCTYEQKTYHKIRSLSSWGMHQLEIFMKKIIFFQNDVPYRELGSRRKRKKLKVPNALCLVHMNRKPTISFKLGHGPA